MKDDESDAIINKVSKIIDSLSFNLNAPADAPYYEKELLHQYHIGIDPEDIHAVYNLIDSMENGRGIHIHHHCELLLQFLYNAAFVQFLASLAKMKMPHQFVMATQWMSKEQLMNVANQSDLSNKWLLFEIIRQLTDNEKKLPVDDIVFTAVASLISRLYQLDIKFYKQTSTYFERNMVFNRAHGRMLATISEDEIVMIVDDCFLFRKSTHYLDEKTALRDEFIAFANQGLQRHFFAAVHQKWESFIDNLLIEEDFMTLNPEITDYANYIITYLLNYVSIEDRSQLWKKAFNNINQLNTIWFTDSSNRRTKFLLLLGKLYIYVLSVHEDFTKKINDDLRQRLEELFTDPIINKRFLQDHSSTYTLSAQHIVKDMSTKFGIGNLLPKE